MHNSSDWNPNVVVDEQQSPEISNKPQSGTPTASLLNGKVNGHSVTLEGPQLLSNTPTVTHHSVPGPAQAQRRAPSPAIKSPCFVHSKLQSASLMDWLGTVHDDKPHDLHDKKPHHHSPTHTDGTVSDYSETLSPYDDDEREYAPSLTKKLAETAVGVREVSKKLG